LGTFLSLPLLSLTRSFHTLVRVGGLMWMGFRVMYAPPSRGLSLLFVAFAFRRRRQRVVERDFLYSLLAPPLPVFSYILHTSLTEPSSLTQLFRQAHTVLSGLFPFKAPMRGALIRRHSPFSSPFCELSGQVLEV